MKYEALRKEIDGMLSLLPGDWTVSEASFEGGPLHYALLARDGNVLLTAGRGRTKTEALENILEGWRKGVLEPYAPAAGSAEELRLKMAVIKG